MYHVKVILAGQADGRQTSEWGINEVRQAAKLGKKKRHNIINLILKIALT